jgi:hypothetical protein
MIKAEQRGFYTNHHHYDVTPVVMNIEITRGATLTLDPQFAAHGKIGTKPSGEGAHYDDACPI